MDETNIKRTKWLNRGIIVAFFVGVLVGLCAPWVWSGIRERLPERVEATQQAPPVDSTAVSLKLRAKQGCYSLSTAIEAYTQNPQNPERDNPNEMTKLPQRLDDLNSPPFGGPSFLRNRQADLIDPWGKAYQMERLPQPKNDAYILVKTTAPDGTLITQFGIGADAMPK